MEQLPQFKLDSTQYDLNSLTFLGEGAYGKVYKASSKAYGQVAIKQTSMKKIKMQGLAQALLRQIKLMEQLKSPNIVSLYDYHIGEQYTYMVLQLCDSDLRKFLLKCSKRLPESDCVNIFGEIIKGFQTMVENSCIHRDIKPQNILLKQKQYKLADFGFACKADMLGIQKLDEICGTPIYMAPQLLRNQPYNAKCDIWSLGLVLYELIYGYPPWPMKCPQSYLESIKKRPLSFPFDVKIGKQTKDFLKKALQQDEKKRMGWQQLFKHPLVANKVTGQVIISKHVEPKIRRIMSIMQGQAESKFINQVQLFKKYEDLTVMDRKQFQELLTALNPTITTNEIELIFKSCDCNQNGEIDKAQFQDMFCNTNFRKNPAISREIDELIGIITARGIDVEQLFEEVDANHTGALDSKQFKNFVLKIAPKYNEHLIGELYKNFDKDGNKLVDKSQFMKVLCRNLMSQKNYIGVWLQRAQRNLKTLKICLKDEGLTFDEVMKLADLNLDKHIDKSEFEQMLAKINFKISQTEIDEIFKMIDQNQSQKISLLELHDFMK